MESTNQLSKVRSLSVSYTKCILVLSALMLGHGMLGDALVTNPDLLKSCLPLSSESLAAIERGLLWWLCTSVAFAVSVAASGYVAVLRYQVILKPTELSEEVDFIRQLCFKRWHAASLASFVGWLLVHFFATGFVLYVLAGVGITLLFFDAALHAQHVNWALTKRRLNAMYERLYSVLEDYKKGHAAKAVE